MDGADDRPRPGPDKRYLSLSEHAVVGIPWRSPRRPDDVRRDEVIPFSVAAARLDARTGVGLAAATAWLFHGWDYWPFVLYDKPPPSLPSFPLAFPFSGGLDAVARSSLKLLLDEVDAAAPHLRGEVHSPGAALPRNEPNTPRAVPAQSGTKAPVPVAEMLDEMRRRAREHQIER